MRHYYLKFPLIFLALFVSLNTLQAQEILIGEEDDPLQVERTPRFVAGLYYNGMFPLSRFQENLQTTYHGLGADFLYRFNKNNPLYVGLGINAFLGNSEFIEYPEIIDGEFFNTRETTSANVVSANALFRFMPDLYKWYEPFGEVHLGYKFLFTHTTFKDIDADDVFDSNFEETDWSLSFGVGAGCNFYLFNDYVRISTKIAYSKGIGASYHVESPTDNGGDPIDRFELRSSATDIVVLHIGVATSF